MSFSCFTTPAEMSRDKHIQMIRFIFKTEGIDAATKYWLTHCPRISRKAFNSAIS